MNVLALALLLLAEGTYRVLPEESRFEVEVGRAGLFKMFGHDHRIEVRSFEGSVDWRPERVEDSSFQIEIDARSLTVVDEELSEDDRRTVQTDMETKALALPEHPRIVFRSTGVGRGTTRGRSHELKIIGTLELRGVSRSLEVPVIVTETEGRLRVAGNVELESDKWGVPQIAAAGGSIKTREKLGLSFDLIAVP